LESGSPESFLPLSPQVFAVLLALADCEKHGYAIMRAVEEQTNGAMTLGPGTLYGSLKRLLGQGLVEETEPKPDDEGCEDERRRYYRLTGLGNRVIAAETARLERQLATVRRIVPVRTS